MTSQHPTSERHPTIREAVCTDKVIWLGGVLSSAPTVGYLRPVGILSLHILTPPLVVTIVPLCSTRVKARAVNNFSSADCRQVLTWRLPREGISRHVLKMLPWRDFFLYLFILSKNTTVHIISSAFRSLFLFPEQQDSEQMLDITPLAVFQ